MRSCYWDSTHVLTAYAVYDIAHWSWQTVGHDMPTAVNAVVGNWPSIRLFPGTPASRFTIRVQHDQEPGYPRIGRTALAPFVSQDPVSTAASNGLARASLQTPAPVHSGTVPSQGPAIGPGYFDADISLQKNFPIY